ncbi:MAG: hypothetical protein EBE86_020595 [Hormoscilla sp. GUM202]|nr:hypothetical protein [Hormoscilla sp. GUM202]
MMPSEQHRQEKPLLLSRRQQRLLGTRRGEQPWERGGGHNPAAPGETGGQGMLRAEKARALEVTVRLTVNLVLAAAATSGLMRLLPLYQSVQEKSGVIQTEVRRTEERVNRWQRDFNRAFDPGQAKTVMQEESHRVAPQRRPIVLIEENK